MPPTRYRKLAVIGLVLGLPAIAYAVYQNFQLGWPYAQSFFLNGQFNYWASILVSLAYVSIIMLWWQQRVGRCVGRCGWG